MRNETPASTAPNRQLTRGERVRRRMTPAVVALGVTATAVIAGASGDKEKDRPNETIERVVIPVELTGEFEEGVAPQETVMNSIRMAVENATYKGFSELGLSEDVDVLKIVSEVPVFDVANKALEMGDNGELPDPGDPFIGEGNVIVDEDKNVSFELIDAKIID